jgi:hypothetical protein
LPERLHDVVVQKIDAANSSFWAANNSVAAGGNAKLGLTERQRLKLWMNHAHSEIEGASV